MQDSMFSPQKRFQLNTSCFGKNLVFGGAEKIIKNIGEFRYFFRTLGCRGVGEGHGAADVLLDSSSGSSGQLTLTASMLFCVGQLTLKDGPNEETYLRNLSE